MNIDTQPLIDFEREYSVVLDALEQLKRLEPPVESEGPQGLARWFRDFHQSLLTLTTAPDGAGLTRFAEDVEAALAKVDGMPALGPRPLKSEMLPTPRGFWAEIVSETGSGAYTFKEKRLTDGTTWADASGGLTGTCYEANDVTGVPNATDDGTGAIVEITVRYDTSGNLRYVFDSSLPVPLGTADGQMLAWDHTTDKAWKLILPPEGLVHDTSDNIHCMIYQLRFDRAGRVIAYAGPCIEHASAIHWFDVVGNHL